MMDNPRPTDSSPAARPGLSRAELDNMVRRLIDQGLLIEAGFAILRSTCMDPASPPVQVREMHLAFFAGAQHVFSSIMMALDPDEEPTEADLRRMTIISNELEAFARDFEARVLPTSGRA